MSIRTAAFGAVLVVATSSLPASGASMGPDEARDFVAGKVFSFECSDGTRGTGAFLEHGGVYGEVKFSDREATKSVRLPDRTIQVRGGAVCASLHGLPFDPCFKLDRTGEGTFRGAVAGMEFMHCDFRHEPDLMVVPRHQPRE